MDREMKIWKYVSTHVLSAFYKAVVDLQIVGVKVICYLTLPNPMWHMDPEIKMQKYFSTWILSGSYKAAVDLQIVKVKVLYYMALRGSYLAYGSRNLNAIICFYPDPIWFL